MSIKKYVVWISIIILLFTLCLGCISNVNTTFSIISSGFIDYYGFPSLSLDYSSNDGIIVKVVDPNDQIIFTDEFYFNQSNMIIPLATYRNLSDPGYYKLNIYDRNVNLIFNKSFILNNTKVSIDSVLGHWWKENINDSVFVLIGLSLKVTNNGDLPIYPYSFNFSMDNTTFIGKLLPEVILPKTTKFVNCSFFVYNINSVEKNCTMTIKSKNNKLLSETNFKLIAQENTPTITYKWSYKGKREINIPYPTFLHEYYNSLERINTNDYAAYVFDPYDDLFLTLVLNSIYSSYNNGNDVSKTNLIASFIQNLEYEEDDPQNSSFEYPLYPIELLNNRSCDCEDRSILGSNLLILGGYNVSLLSLPKHMAIGINLNQKLPDYKFYVDNYYYLETTIKDMVLGEVPKLYRNISDQTIIYNLNSRPVLNHEWIKTDGILYDGELDFVKLKIIVENLGNVIAENIKITGAFYSEDNTNYNQETIVISNLSPQEKQQIILKINAPKDISVILKTKIYLDDVFVEEKQSTNEFS